MSPMPFSNGNGLPSTSPLGPVTFMLSELSVPIPNTSEPRPKRRQLTLGIDVAQLGDFTALAVVERVRDADGVPGYQCSHLERLQRGTKYPEQARLIGQLVNRLGGLGQLRTFLDATGVGRALVDLFEVEGLRFKAITLTGGTSVSEPRPGEVSVPKRDVVAATQAMLSSGRLTIASQLPDARVLVSELLAFDATISATGHDRYDARSGEHDDLVLALSLALWGAEGAGHRRARLIA